MAKFQSEWRSQRSFNTMMINRMKTQNWEADSHTSSPLCWEVSCCQSDSLIDNSKNRKGHKSCLPRHLCFPRKSKFIETKSSACCTLCFFFWQVYFLGPWALMFSISLSRYPEYTNLFSIWKHRKSNQKHEKHNWQSFQGEAWGQCEAAFTPPIHSQGFITVRWQHNNIFELQTSDQLLEMSTAYIQLLIYRLHHLLLTVHALLG